MNHIFRSIWNKETGTFVAVSENTKGGGKSASGGGGAAVVGAGFMLKTLAASLLMAFGAHALAGPTGGVVVAGNATIVGVPGNTVIQQGSQNVALNWQSFNIAAGEAVTFVQPNSSAVALNRVLGADPSSILGNLSANGKVFLVNPNGILFGKGASVNVGGLVASTLNIGDADFMAGRYKFTGNGTGSIVNQGSINADGGYVALLGANVSNQGTINARLGTVALAAGNAMTLDVAGDGLLSVTVDQGALNALVENGGMIQADGGRVLLTAQAAGDLLHTAVNNSGIIQAQTIDTHNGNIRLLGDMQSGVVNAGGTLDASAPLGGNGGFIETSAAHVKLADSLRVSTAAGAGKNGTTGSWLIDPNDYTIAASGGDVTGAQLSALLTGTDIIIYSARGAGQGMGDVHVNDNVAWSANRLTLNAFNNINLNANLSASGSARLALEYGMGAPAGSNSSKVVYNGGSITLPAGTTNFTTRQGFDGALKNYTVITALGAQNSQTGADLQGMNGNLYANYVLGSNIDATATAGWNNGWGFQPIYELRGTFNDNGGYYGYVGATFDGLGHTISNLAITPGNNPEGSALFVSIGSRSTVQNLRLTGARIGAVAASGSETGSGVLTRYNNGTISNVHVSGDVAGSQEVGMLVGENGGLIIDSSAAGTLIADYAGGGLVGINYGSIVNSYSSATVSGDVNTGGLAGKHYGLISGSYATGAVTGTQTVGGLVGESFYGVMENSHASGDVSVNRDGAGGGLVGTIIGAAVSNSYATGNVRVTGDGNGAGAGAGGLVGIMSSGATVTSSYASGNVTSSSSQVGGLVGAINGTDPQREANGSIRNSYSLGNVLGADSVGGITGYSAGLIDNVYSSGAVGGLSNVGALVGSLNGSLTGVYNTTVNPGVSDVGVAGSFALNNGTTGLSSIAMQTAANFTGFTFTTVAGAAGNNWVMVDANGTLNNDASAVGATRPMLATEYSTTINNAHQLQLMAMAPSAAYVLGKNIDAAATATGADVWGSAGFVPVTISVGSFDGRGHTISNLNINRYGANNTGLFGYAESALVQNVGLVDAHVVGGSATGALIGTGAANAVVLNSYVIGGAVTGTEQVGGLVGVISAEVNGSYATATVTGTNFVGGLVGRNNAATIINSYASGAVSGSNGVGGLVGYNDGFIGTSYASGAVRGVQTTGGLTGQSGQSGWTYSSYWDIDSSGQRTSADGNGLSSAAMLSTGSFTSFNFTTTPGAMSQWVLVDVDGTLNNANGAAGATRPMLAAEYATTINTAHQLQLMSMNLAVSYSLGNNIAASATAGGSDVWAGGSFIPVGDATAKFTGGFDGRGFAIAGLTVNRPGIDYAGLFGYAGGGAVLTNVSLDGGRIVGGSHTGALAGRIDAGLVSGSHASAAVAGTNLATGGLVGTSDHSTVGNSYASGAVTGVNDNVGGLIGNMQGGAVFDSYAEGALTGGASNVGGLVGNSQDSAVRNSYASGAVAGQFNVGGLVGAVHGSGTIDNSYAGGSASGNAVIGGLVGLVEGGALSNVYSNGNVTGNDYIGGVVGVLVDFGVNPGILNTSYASGTVSSSGVAGGVAGANFGQVTSSYFDGDRNGGLMVNGSGNPAQNSSGLNGSFMLRADRFNGFSFTTQPGAAGNAWVMVDVDGTLNNANNATGATLPMLASEYARTIRNAHQLQLVSMNVDTSYTLAKNIDATATGGTADVWRAGFNPLGSASKQFSRTFDGQGHTIGGLTINLPFADGVGLFGQLGNGAIVQNLGVNDASVTGMSSVGILAGGSLAAVISNSYATGAVTSSDTFAGGLLGYGQLSVIDSSHANATVTGTNKVGGLVGNNDLGIVNDSYATGTVSGAQNDAGGLIGFNSHSLVSNSHATGAVTSGGDTTGGLVGFNEEGVIGGSYATGAVSGNSSVGGLVGVSQYGQIFNSYANGVVYGAGDFIGGLIGYASGNGGSSASNVSNSYATGAVSGSSLIGGLVGYADGATIANVYATGAVNANNSTAGGLVGQINSGSINNSYATGAMSGDNRIGGLIGTNNGADVQNSYWNTTVFAQRGVGNGSDAGITGLLDADMRNPASFTFNFANTPGATGNGGNNWVMIDADGSANGSGGTMPMLASEYATVIRNAHQLQLMNLDLGASYTLANNIDASGTGAANNLWSGSFIPVGGATVKFAGMFDGQGHTVNGLTLYRPGAEYVGLFGYVYGVVRNVGLSGGSLIARGTAGGLVGMLQNGTVVNSYADTVVSSDGSGSNGNFGGLVGVALDSTIIGSHASGSVDGGSNGGIGGLVGQSYVSSVRDSYATGTVTSNGNGVGGLVGLNQFGEISASYASGAVSGASIVGGLVGYNDRATVMNSYAGGAVTGIDTIGGFVGLSDGTIGNSYANGAVALVADSGGFAGLNFGSVIASFWDPTTSGQSNSAGGYGMSTVAMRTKANFTSATSDNGNTGAAWDMNNTWIVYEGHTAPLLRSFMTALTVSASSAVKTYDGNAYSGTPTVTYSLAPHLDLLDSSGLVFGGNAPGALNAGVYGVTAGGLFSSQNGYAISYANGAVVVNKAVLTAQMHASDKTYDGSASATVMLDNINGLVGGDQVNISNSATFNSKDVLAANTVTIDSVSLTDGPGGLASNYTMATGQTAAATITPKALTATVTGVDKVYDGNLAAVANVLITDGLLANETLGASATGVFNSKNVASASHVTVDSISLADGAGGLASNYSLAGGQVLDAAITAKALTATVSAAPKTYDGSAVAAATLAITDGLVLGETVTATGTATFNSKDVATADVVTVNATTLADGTGGLASNYSLGTGQHVNATITAKALTATVSVAPKTYDGSNGAVATLAISDGLVLGETVSATGTATFNSKDVAAATVATVNATTLVSGSNGLASNYSLGTGQHVNASIAAKPLTATVSVAPKTYDGSAAAVATLAITGGLVAGETVSATGSATFNTKDVATANLVTVNATTLADGSNGLASNYSLVTGQTRAAAISAKALSAIASALDKSYDGNTVADASLQVTLGLVNDETVLVTASGNFNNRNVLDASMVSIDSALLADGTHGGLASNYSIGTGQLANAHITAKALTATVSAVGKTYDGNATAAATLTITDGLIAGETVSANGAATFNSKDVLAAHVVTVNGVTLVNGLNGLASNYSLVAGQSANAAIAAKALTASASASGKTYDGDATAAATLTVTDGLITGETVGATGSATFNSKDVLAAHVVTVNGVTLVNGTNGLASNYSLVAGQSANAAIAAKALTAIASASGKTYDGDTTAAATLTVTDGLVTGETVGATGSATFNSKDVLAAHVVTVNGVTLVNGPNGLASNYSLVAGQSAHAAIAARALTAIASAAGKTYDGDTIAAATLAITDGLVGAETLGATATALFNSKDVLAANLVTVNGATLADGSNGGLASNYVLASGQTAAAIISAKALTASATAANKTYDGDTAAAATLAITGGLVGDESIGATGTATFNSKDVLAANLVTVNGATLANGSNGGLASNYVLASGQTAAATIAAKTLTASATAASKTYDGNAAAAATLAITGGLVGAESLGATGTATFNSKDVLAANLVTVDGATLANGSNGGLASNYVLASGQTAAAIISAKALTASATAANKTYDGDTAAAATLAITGGLVGDETLGATGTATFNSKDVLAASLVTINGATLANGSNGGLASNYVLASGQTAVATIAAKALTASVTAANKTYDGDTAAAATLAITGGLVGDETLGATGTATFNSKDVLAANLVTVNATTLADGSNGGLASNYVLASGQTAAAIISAKVLTASATAANKTYDGDTAAAATLAITGGLVGDETLGATGTATFNSKDVLTANLVTVNATTLADGSNGGLASNYVLGTGQTTAAIISAKVLAASATAANKTYDGNTAAAATLAITGGLVGDETLGATGTATFNSKDVLAANLVTVNATTLADGSNGGLASNYVLASGQTAAAIISAKALTASATAANKTYDGNTAATAQLAITGGLVGIETVTANGVATFNSKDVQDASLVTVNSAALSNGTNGGLASNYSLASGQTAAAAITPKALTATAVASNKIYDGSTSAAAALAITAGLVGSETVGATGAASFNSKDVVSARLVTIDSTALSNGANGGLASNYRLAAGQTATAVITPKSVSVSGLAALNKVYDGSAAASLTGGVVTGLIGAETVALTGQTGAFNDKNVGTAKLVVVSGATLANGSGLASNYRLTAPAALTADIARLAAVTWVGGASGSWFDANNWAGGAVPDLANVASVLIPAGVTVTFSNGAVSVDAIGTGGALNIEGGSLAVANTLSLGALTQSGGAVSAGAVTLGSLAQSGGSLASRADVVVTSSYRQTGSGSVAAAGKLTITQATGAASLGNITSGGPLSVTAVQGDITQLAGSHIVAPSATVSAPAGTVTLASSGNTLGAIVVSDGAVVAPIIVPLDSAQLNNAIAGAISMDAREVAPLLAAAPAKSTGRALSGGRSGGVLEGLNVTLVGEGMLLPEGVAMASESADAE